MSDLSCERMRELALLCRVSAALKLPRTRLRAEALRGLCPGSILELGLPARVPAQFYAGGLPLFSAAPVGQADHRAAQMLASLEAQP